MEPFLFKVTSVYPYIHGALHELGRGKHHVGGSRPQVPGDDPRSLLTIKEGTVLPTPVLCPFPCGVLLKMEEWSQQAGTWSHLSQTHLDVPHIYLWLMETYLGP